MAAAVRAVHDYNENAKKRKAEEELEEVLEEPQLAPKPSEQVVSVAEQVESLEEMLSSQLSREDDLFAAPSTAASSSWTRRSERPAV